MSALITRGNRPTKGNHGGLPPTVSLPDIVRRFKTLTTKRYANGVKQNGWTPFHGKLWQRNYYEYIIRNEKDLNGIREYIAQQSNAMGLGP